MLRLEPHPVVLMGVHRRRRRAALGTLDISNWWRERGALIVDGGGRSPSPARGSSRATSGSNRTARSWRPRTGRACSGAGSTSTFSGRTLRLRPRSAWGRALVLHEGEREVGDISRRAMWSRGATATLPDTLPMPVRLFVLWLAVLIWKRDDDAAASAG